MNRTMRLPGIWLGLTLAIALTLCHADKVSRGQEKRDGDEKKSEETKKVKEPQPRFVIQGGFRKGLLLRRQEEVDPLASFSTRDPLLVPEDYRVSIDWGDNSGVTKGQIISLRHGFHHVAGHHLYTATGCYAVKVRVTGGDGTTAVVRSTIEVGDLYAGSLDEFTVASIPVGDAASSIGDWRTTIDWGDGSPASAGFIHRDGDTFHVGGSHAYAHGGLYTVSVLATDGAAVPIVRKRVIRVVPPLIDLKVFGHPVTSFTNIEKAHFRVPNPLATADDFSALINWGDGTPIDTAVIVGSGGEFRVLASHTYDGPGPYYFRVLIMQKWH